jgi:hypothetical protein
LSIHKLGFSQFTGNPWILDEVRGLSCSRTLFVKSLPGASWWRKVREEHHLARVQSMKGGSGSCAHGQLMASSCTLENIEVGNRQSHRAEPAANEDGGAFQETSHWLAVVTLQTAPWFLSSSSFLN